MIDGRKIKPGDVDPRPAVERFAHQRLFARPKNFVRENEAEARRECQARADVGDELLRVHKNYQPLLAKAPNGMIKGLAHITGGGLIDNLPRILPKNCDAVIDTKSWRVPRIFQILQQNGKVSRAEMYQVFNMGIGMVAIVAERDARRATSMLGAKRIGRIERGSGKTRLVF